jgi:hypothetical protein
MFPQFGFSIQEYFICYFYCKKKRPLYVNFSIPLCGNWWFLQGSTPRVGMRFCGHVPNSPRNKNLKRHIRNLLENVVFLDPKRLLSPFGRGKKNFFFNLATRSYGWKYQNWFQFCTIRLTFKRGCLEAVLSKNTLRPLGVKHSCWLINFPKNINLISRK